MPWFSKYIIKETGLNGRIKDLVKVANNEIDTATTENSMEVP